MLPYGEQIRKIGQSLGVIVTQLQQSILEKVTTLLTENIHDLIPELPTLKKSVKSITTTAETQGKSGQKTLAIAQDA